MTKDWTAVELEALASVTGEADPEKAYALLLQDGTLIEKHRQLVEANSPKKAAGAPKQEETAEPEHPIHKSHRSGK